MTRNMQTNARFKHTPQGLLDLGPASTMKQIMGITSRTIKVGSIILFEYFELSQSSKTQRPSDELMHTLNPSHKARKVDCRHEQSEEATIEQRSPQVNHQRNKRQMVSGRTRQILHIRHTTPITTKNNSFC